jgi:hypothetical protein
LSCGNEMTNWVESHFEHNPDIGKLPVVARSRYSLHLRRSRGQRLALITGSPMHYFSAANLEWLPIDTRLQPKGDGSFGVPGLPFALSQDGSIALEGNPHRHRTWRVGIVSTPPELELGNPQAKFHEIARLPAARLHGDRLIRESSSIKHETILLPGGLREELTLFNAPKLDAGSGGLFAMETLLPVGLSSSNTALSRTLLLELLLLDNGIQMPQGWAQDAAGRRTPLLRWIDPTGRLLYSGVPVDWLATAEYPVVLDPDIDITGSTADGYIEGASGATSTTYDSSSSTMNVGGRNVSGSIKVWRGYVKFNTSSLGPASAVERANLQMFPSGLNDDVAWTIYVRQYNWSANDPMATGTREAAWDGLAGAANSAELATSADPAGTPVVSEDLPTEWVELEGNTYYGLWCDQETYPYPSNQGGQHQYSTAEHSTPSQRPMLMIEYLGSYPLSGPVSLRAILRTPRVSLPDTRVILRSRERRIALTAKSNG